jgi:predicted DNA-binding transcriptional regulator YafY
MPKDTQYGPRARVIRMLRLLADAPRRYTKVELARNYGVSDDTITDDIQAIESAGFLVEKDNKYRYYLVPDKPLKQIEELLYFSEEERLLLREAIHSLPCSQEHQQRMHKKIASIYDFSRLGLPSLRKPHLSKVDALLEAQHSKKRTLLKNYRSSNSNNVQDRVVEPFHTNLAEDMLQAYDIEKKQIRHYRISRIQSVKLLQDDWEYEGSHNILRTDPFRIVSNDQVNIHLRLSVGACNELLERYPLAKGFVMETEDPHYSDFQCMVNSNFYGLTNFILGYFHLEMEIIAPDSLRAHLRKAVMLLEF